MILVLAEPVLNRMSPCAPFAVRLSVHAIAMGSAIRLFHLADGHTELVIAAASGRIRRAAAVPSDRQPLVRGSAERTAPQSPRVGRCWKMTRGLLACKPPEGDHHDLIPLFKSGLDRCLMARGLKGRPCRRFRHA